MQDDLRPLSCRGSNSQGGIALTLIDSLDSLIVSGWLGFTAAAVAPSILNLVRSFFYSPIGLLAGHSLLGGVGC